MLYRRDGVSKRHIFRATPDSAFVRTRINSPSTDWSGPCTHPIKGPNPNPGSLRNPGDPLPLHPGTTQVDSNRTAKSGDC
jgi:hypothetical protein